jgi:hypothetical protein
MLRPLAVLLLLAPTASASAQVTDGPVSPPAAVGTPASGDEETAPVVVLVEARSLGTAWAYSIAGTLAPACVGLALLVLDGDGAGLGGVGAALFNLGVLAGPSAGHAYLGDERRFWIGVGLRLVGVSAGLAIGHALDRDDEFLDLVPTESQILILVGLAGSTAYSLATLGPSARERNVALAPGVGLGGTPTLSLHARF